MGLFGIVWKIVAVVILAVVFLGAYLYFSDYEVDATVSDRGEDSGGRYVVVKPDLKLIPYEHKAYLSADEHAFVCEGYKVSLRIKSLAFQVFDGRTAENDGRGRLVYDSASGLQDEGALLRCAATNFPVG